MPTILVVEDDKFVRTLVTASFANEGFTVTDVGDGRGMVAALERQRFDLLILDLGLPDEDGLVLARRVRRYSAMPIIVLTARSSRADRIAALELGADDYLIKPFDIRELILRARNLLSRVGGGAPDRNTLSFEGWRLEPNGRTLTRPDGVTVQLTPAEARLLGAFLRTPMRPLTRTELLDAAARDEDSASERMIDVLVSSLRRKIEPNPRRPSLIVTVHGMGYKFAPPRQ